jgi:hypothetical protein
VWATVVSDWFHRLRFYAISTIVWASVVVLWYDGTINWMETPPPTEPMEVGQMAIPADQPPVCWNERMANADW